MVSRSAYEQAQSAIFTGSDLHFTLGRRALLLSTLSARLRIHATGEPALYKFTRSQCREYGDIPYATYLKGNQ